MYTIKIIIDFNGEVNIIRPSFVTKLGFCIRKTVINTQKIDNNRLTIFGKVITSFLVDNKNKKFRFFEESFLLIHISINITFEIFFLTLSNVKINLNNWKLK